MANGAIRFLIGGALVGLAACDDGVVVNRSEVAGGYTGDFYVQTQAQNGTNAVIVRNSPFSDAAVVQALRARYQSSQYRFELGPTPPEWNGYTVVIGFGGAPAGIQNLCNAPNLPLRTMAAGRTEVMGAYCYGNILISEVQGSVSAVGGPDDPKFTNLMGDVVAELFYDKRRYGGHGKGSTPP